MEDLLWDMIRGDPVLHQRNTLKGEGPYRGGLFLQILWNSQAHLGDGGRILGEAISISTRTCQRTRAIRMRDQPSQNACLHLLLKTTKSRNHLLRHLNLKATKLLSTHLAQIIRMTNVLKILTTYRW